MNYIHYKGFKFLNKFKNESLHIQKCFKKSLIEFLEKNENLLIKFDKKKIVYTEHMACSWSVDGICQH